MYHLLKKKLFTQKKRFLISLSIFLLITSTILSIFLINPIFFYKYLVPSSSLNNAIFIFRDWQVILNAAKCYNLGYDVYLNNPCDPFNSLHVYGSILLKIPIKNFLQFFYLIVFPLTINGIFIAIIIAHFKFENKLEYLMPILFLLSPSTLLVLERFNIEIFIFLSLLTISYFGKNILAYVLIILVSMTKFYPIVLSIFFIIKDNIDKKKIFYLLFTIITFLSFIIYEKESLIKIYNNQGQFTAYITTNFSIFAFKNLISKFYNLNWNIVFILFLFINLIFSKNFIKKKSKNFFENEKINTYEEILFILGVFMLIFTYYIFSNFYYREIYIFCLIPFMLKKVKFKTDSIYRYFLYLLCIRYIFFIFMNHYIVFNPNGAIIFIKLSLDLILMFYVLTFFLYINLFIIKKIKIL